MPSRLLARNASSMSPVIDLIVPEPSPCLQSESSQPVHAMLGEVSVCSPPPSQAECRWFESGRPFGNSLVDKQLPETACRTRQAFFASFGSDIALTTFRVLVSAAQGDRLSFIPFFEGTSNRRLSDDSR